MKTPPYHFIELDLETLSVTTDAAIIQIAAAYIPANMEFDCPKSFMEGIDNRYDTYVDPKETVGNVDIDTVIWHADQPTGIAALRTARQLGIDEVNAIAALCHWKDSVASPSVYNFCQSANFDWPILSTTVEKYPDLKKLWEYSFPFYQNFCSRTIQQVIPLMSGLPICDWGTNVPRESFGKPHDAMADVLYQAYKHCLLYEKFGTELNRLFVGSAQHDEQPRGQDTQDTKETDKVKW